MVNTALPMIWPRRANRRFAALRVEGLISRGGGELSSSDCVLRAGSRIPRDGYRNCCPCLQPPHVPARQPIRRPELPRRLPGRRLKGAAGQRSTPHHEQGPHGSDVHSLPRMPQQRRGRRRTLADRRRQVMQKQKHVASYSSVKRIGAGTRNRTRRCCGSPCSSQ